MQQTIRIPRNRVYRNSEFKSMKCFGFARRRYSSDAESVCGKSPDSQVPPPHESHLPPGEGSLLCQDLFMFRSRPVANVPWHGIARQPGAELANQFSAALFRDLEMRGPGHAVELVQIIGHHT